MMFSFGICPILHVGDDALFITSCCNRALVHAILWPILEEIVALGYAIVIVVSLYWVYIWDIDQDSKNLEAGT
jgi:hypothetical protein